MTVDLEESSGADLILAVSGSIADRRCARLREQFQAGRRFLLRALPRSEETEADQGGQLAAESLRPAQEILFGRIAAAECRCERLFVAGVSGPRGCRDRQ